MTAAAKSVINPAAKKPANLTLVETEATLVNKITDALREDVLMGALTPGQRIPESAIAARFKVSRTPAREALRLLAAEGVVALRSHRGAEVPEYSLRLITDTIELVERLESAAGEIACRRVSDDEIRWLDFMTREMVAAYQADDRVSYYNLNRRIHYAIVAATRNSALINAYRDYNARLFRVRFVALHPNKKLWREAVREHRDMVKLLKNRDGAALGALLRGHMSHAWRRAGHDPAGDFAARARAAPRGPARTPSLTRPRQGQAGVTSKGA